MGYGSSLRARRVINNVSIKVLKVKVPDINGGDCGTFITDIRISTSTARIPS